MLRTLLLFLFSALVLSQCPYEPKCTQSEYAPEPDCTSRDFYRNVTNASAKDVSKYVDVIYAPVVTSDNQNFFYWARGASEARTECVRTEILRLICNYSVNQTVWKRVGYAWTRVKPDRNLPPENELENLSVDQMKAYRMDLINIHADESLLIAGDC